MKKLLCILLAGLSVFTLTACNKTDSLQTEVDALKQSLAELQATVSSQSEQISTLQGEKAAQAEKIAELEAAKAAQAGTIEELEKFKEKLDSSEEIPCTVGFFNRSDAERLHLFLIYDSFVATSLQNWETFLLIREDFNREEFNAKYTEAFFETHFLIVVNSAEIYYGEELLGISINKKYDYYEDSDVFEIEIKQRYNHMLGVTSGCIAILEVENEYFSDAIIRMKGVEKK